MPEFDDPRDVQLLDEMRNIELRLVAEGPNLGVGGPAAAEIRERLEKAVRLSPWPQVIQLYANSSGVDEELERFMLAETGSFEYFEVRFACEFEPFEGYIFTRAEVKVSLQGANGQQGDAMIWRLVPNEQSSLVTYMRGIEYGPDAKGVGIKWRKETQSQGQFMLIRTHDVGSREARWEFSDDPYHPRHPIRGARILSLVARMPAGHIVRGVVTVGVSANIRGWIREYRSAAQRDLVSTAFLIPPRS